jgi:flagellar biosynthetic protein FlhB
VFVAAISINVLQVGFLFTTETLTPKFSVLNPIEGSKRFFSVRALVDLAKAVLKIAIVLGVAWFTLKGSVLELSAAAMSPLGATLALSKSLFFRLTLRILAVFTVMAALDWMFQRWDFEKRLRMSHQDVKEENKQSDGNPLVKSRIRTLQIQNARKRMMSAVKTADVVVTNPTHLAVALSYKAGEMEAPTVVAKGARLMAQKIKEIARENGVPVIEDKPLARALFKSVEIGQPVPPALYRAVAEILAYVFRLKGRRS